MKKLVDTPHELFCKLCGKYIEPVEKFIRSRETGNVYCSRRCFYYDFLQSEKKIDPTYAELNNILEHHHSNTEQKMILLEAINEITSFVFKFYGVYWFFPEVYIPNKWNIYQMFKKFNAIPVDLDKLASELNSMRYVGVCS